MTTSSRGKVCILTRAMIRNLIFDFGKVLVDYDYELFFRSFIPDPQRRREFDALLCRQDVQEVFDREAVPFEEIIGGFIANNPDFEPELRYFMEHYTEVVTGEVPGMRDLLTGLKAEGYRLYGLSNWCSRVHITMSQFSGIFGLLDGYIISSEEKLIKPEPAIYQRLFDKFGLRPEECIFTDDRSDNIDAALRMGMPGILFQTARQYESELRKVLE